MLQFVRCTFGATQIYSEQNSRLVRRKSMFNGGHEHRWKDQARPRVPVHITTRRSISECVPSWSPSYGTRANRAHEIVLLASDP